MHKKGIILIVAAILGLGAMLWAQHTDETPASRPAFEHSGFALITANGTRHTFKAEVARSEEEQAYGLMYVEKMRDDEGMIFSFARPKMAAFWMKNTLIPLDMIFVRPGGTVSGIAADRQPGDVTPVIMQEPVISVIEINAGLAKKYGLEVGNKVEFPINRPINQ